MNLFWKRSGQINSAHAEATLLLTRADKLIEQLGAVRGELTSFKAKDTPNSAPRCFELGNFLHNLAREQLSESAVAYRTGESLKHRLDIAYWALQMARGLTGGNSTCQYQALGSRIHALELNLSKKETATKPGAELAEELLSSAVQSTRDYFAQVFNYPYTSPERLKKIEVSVNRAEEALDSDSAGLRLVKRLDVLKAVVVRLLKAS